MQHRSVCTASCDRRECGSVCSLVENLVLEISLCLILGAARFQILHHEFQRVVGDLDCLADESDLILIFLHPQCCDDRSNVFNRSAWKFLCELLCLYHVVIRQILDLIAVAVEIQGSDVLACHQTVYHALKGIQETNVIDSGDLLCLGYGYFSSKPSLLVQIRFLDKQNGFLLFCGLFHHQDHVISAKTGQIEKVAVCFKRQIFVCADMQLDSRKQKQCGILVHFIQNLFSSFCKVHLSFLTFF